MLRGAPLTVCPIRRGRGGGVGWDPPPPRVPLWSPLKAGQKASILLALKAPKQNFGCQPQTLAGEEGGGGSRGGGYPPPPPTVYGRSDTSLPPNPREERSANDAPPPRPPPPRGDHVRGPTPDLSTPTASKTEGKFDLRHSTSKRDRGPPRPNNNAGAQQLLHVHFQAQAKVLGRMVNQQRRRKTGCGGVGGFVVSLRWGRLLSVTNAIEAGMCRQGDSGWA